MFHTFTFKWEHFSDMRSIAHAIEVLDVGYQNSVIINILSLRSVIDKAIFTITRGDSRVLKQFYFIYKFHIQNNSLQQVFNL